jgi:hypothetical protein
MDILKGTLGEGVTAEHALFHRKALGNALVLR